MVDSPLVLSVETATRRGSVCLMRDGELLGSAIGDPDESHSNTLLSDINQLLIQNNHSLADVKLFAAAAGPGSFTGLRIGLASIKALAATLHRPCIAVPTLQAVALAGGVSKTSVALLPAGRGELFAQMLSILPDRSVVELDQPVHVSPGELHKKYGELVDIRWCGEGAHAHRDEIKRWAEQHGFTLVEAPVDPSSKNPQGWTLAPPELMLAAFVAELARKKFNDGDIGDPNNLRALYVRPSDAELKSNVDHAGSC